MISKLHWEKNFNKEVTIIIYVKEIIPLSDNRYEHKRFLEMSHAINRENANGSVIILHPKRSAERNEIHGKHKRQS